MPIVIAVLLMLIVTIVLLIQKRRHAMLFGNLLFIGICEGAFGLGIVWAEGWVGIPLILTAFGFGGVHLLILFILAISLPPRTDDIPQGSPAVKPTVHKAMQNLPAQDPARLKAQPQPIRKTEPNTAEKLKTSKDHVWNAKQKELLNKLDDRSGGELSFDS